MLFAYNEGKANVQSLVKELIYIKSMFTNKNIEKIKIILDSKIIMYIVRLIT